MERESRDPHPPEAVHRVDDEASGLTAFVCLHDTSLGPALGGIRFRSYPDDTAACDDAVELARQMSWKCALAELPAGGGKAVVRVDSLRLRRRAAEVLGDFVESLGGRFRTAGDLGATDADLAAVARRTRYIARAPLLGDLGDATALGIAATIEALAPRLGRRAPAELSVLVQGLGSIGLPLVRRLLALGARVLAADLDPEAVERARQLGPIEPVAAGLALATPADVLAPCAAGGLLTEDAARALPVRAVAGGANRVLATPRAGAILFQRGVLYAPDFAVNAGAVIRGGFDQLRGRPGTDAEIRAIGPRVAALFDEAERRAVPPELVAQEAAELCIERARGARRARSAGESGR